MALRTIDLYDPIDGRYRGTRFEEGPIAKYLIKDAPISYLDLRTNLLRRHPLEPMGLEREFIGSPSLFE